MEIDILDFIEQCRDLAKQALGKHAGESAIRRASAGLVSPVP